MKVLCWIVIANSLLGIISRSISFKEDSLKRNIFSYVSFVFAGLASGLYIFLDSIIISILAGVALVFECLVMSLNLKEYKTTKENKMNLMAKIITNIIIEIFLIALIVVVIVK